MSLDSAATTTSVASVASPSSNTNVVTAGDLDPSLTQVWQTLDEHWREQARLRQAQHVKELEAKTTKWILSQLVPIMAKVIENNQWCVELRESTPALASTALPAPTVMQVTQVTPLGVLGKPPAIVEVKDLAPMMPIIRAHLPGTWQAVAHDLVCMRLCRLPQVGDWVVCLVPNGIDGSVGVNNGVSASDQALVVTCAIRAVHRFYPATDVGSGSAVDAAGDNRAAPGTLVVPPVVATQVQVNWPCGTVAWLAFDPVRGLASSSGSINAPPTAPLTAPVASIAPVAARVDAPMSRRVVPQLSIEEANYEPAPFFAALLQQMWDQKEAEQSQVAWITWLTDNLLGRSLIVRDHALDKPFAGTIVAVALKQPQPQKFWCLSHITVTISFAGHSSTHDELHCLGSGTPIAVLPLRQTELARFVAWFAPAATFASCGPDMEQSMHAASRHSSGKRHDSRISCKWHDSRGTAYKLDSDLLLLNDNGILRDQLMIPLVCGFTQQQFSSMCTSPKLFQF